MIPQDQKTERRRRMLLALPVLILPFATLMFWALGGGPGVQGKESQKGFNTELPAANNEDEPVDKMGFYTQAEKDELERRKLEKKDPYYNMAFDSLHVNRSEVTSDLPTYPESDSYEPDERKVHKKLNALRAAINQSQQTDGSIENVGETADRNPALEGDLDRLEQMMQRMNNTTVTDDPQMKQANELLENILDLQYPDRVQQRLKQTSEQNRGSVYPVIAPQASDQISTFSHTDQPAQAIPVSSGFFGLDNPVDWTSNSNVAIQAVVHETQTLVNGSTVKLRLTESVLINGIYIPKDQFIFGTAKLNGERLVIEVSSLRYNNRLFPVELDVYDMDGLEGIYIPGAISRDVAKQGAERSLQGIGLTTLDPSLGAQAASAGIEITRNLLSKKVKLVKVQVKAGYQILLMDVTQNKNK